MTQIPPTSLLDDEATLITRLRRENAALREQLGELRAMSFEDSLTGAKNRRYFDERLAAEVDRVSRHPSAGLALLVVDVDAFKQINDTFGHAYGDDVLRFLSSFLKTNVREHDIVCRTGGDEFMVLLPGSDHDGAARMANRIRNGLTAQRAIATRPVTVSIGVAAWTERITEPRDLVDVADADMYRDKSRKRVVRRSAGLTWGKLL